MYLDHIDKKIVRKNIFTFRKKKRSDTLAYTRDDTIPFPEKSTFQPSRRWRCYTHVRKYRDWLVYARSGRSFACIPPWDLTRDGQDLDYTPKEQPGYRKYRTVDLPTRSKARELTDLSSSRRLPRPPLLTPEKAFAKSLASSCISHIRASQLKLKIHNTIR